MPLRTRPEADENVREASHYYAGVDWRRSLAFVRAYDEAVRRIAADPASLPLHPEATGPDVRYVKLAGFPYVVLFRTADPAETVVLAVLHTAAGPGQYRRAERRG